MKAQAKKVPTRKERGAAIAKAREKGTVKWKEFFSGLEAVKEVRKKK